MLASVYLYLSVLRFLCKPSFFFFLAALLHCGNASAVPAVRRLTSAVDDRSRRPLQIAVEDVMPFL